MSTERWRNDEGACIFGGWVNRLILVALKFLHGGFRECSVCISAQRIVSIINYISWWGCDIWRNNYKTQLFPNRVHHSIYYDHLCIYVIYTYINRYVCDTNTRRQREREREKQSESAEFAILQLVTRLLNIFQVWRRAFESGQLSRSNVFPIKKSDFHDQLLQDPPPKLFYLNTKDHSERPCRTEADLGFGGGWWWLVVVGGGWWWLVVVGGRGGWCWQATARLLERLHAEEAANMEALVTWYGTDSRL